MKKFFFYLLPILFIVITSCQKEATDPDLQPPTDGSGGSGTYMPLTKNTYWKFQDSASGSTSTMTALDKTKVINRRQYTAMLFTDATQQDTLYMARQSADYFYYGDVDNGTSSGSFLFHYLNDTAATGHSWQYIAGQGNGFEAQIKTTIVERNLTRTVHGKTYTDVIHSRMDLYYNIYGTQMHATTYDHYIAKNIGFIQIKSSSEFLGYSTTTSSDLIEYQIK